MEIQAKIGVISKMMVVRLLVFIHLMALPRLRMMGSLSAFIDSRIQKIQEGTLRHSIWGIDFNQRYFKENIRYERLR